MFIERLNAATGKQYRLPTEAEWEYAARGGNKSKGYKYSGSNSVENAAWMITNSGYATHPVGTKIANELGIYDMSGNVWEWCYDWYGAYPASAQDNPTGASSGSSRVLRGGSWGRGAGYCRVANRSSPFARHQQLHRSWLPLGLQFRVAGGFAKKRGRDDRSKKAKPKEPSKAVEIFFE